MDPVRSEPTAPHHGRLLVLCERSDIFVGIEFSTSMIHATTELPREHPRHVAALLVAIEEVSHFHLLTQRAFHGLAVTKLELEWQAEVDKLVVLPQLLSGSGSKVVMKALRHALGHSFKLQAGLSPEEVHRYLEATRYVETLLEGKTLRSLELYKPALRSKLRELYRMSWAEKTTTIAA